MRNFFINHLSVNEHCHTLEQAYLAIEGVLDCVNQLWPAIQKERLRLVFDEAIYARSFIKEQNIAATLNSFSKSTDLPRRWYLYSRNRGAVYSEQTAVTVRSTETGEQKLEGTVPDVVLRDEHSWLSFGQNALHEASELVLTAANFSKFAKNAHDRTSLKKLIPIYVRSDKHKSMPLTGPNGVRISPMAISDENAQRLLLLSIEDGGSRWSFLREQRKYFCFKPTHNDLSEYHGFEVERHEIHAHILQAIELN